MARATNELWKWRWSMGILKKNSNIWSPPRRTFHPTQRTSPPPPRQCPSKISPNVAPLKLKTRRRLQLFRPRFAQQSPHSSFLIASFQWKPKIVPPPPKSISSQVCPPSSSTLQSNLQFLLQVLHLLLLSLTQKSPIKWAPSPCSQPEQISSILHLDPISVLVSIQEVLCKMWKC